MLYSVGWQESFAYYHGKPRSHSAPLYRCGTAPIGPSPTAYFMPMAERLHPQIFLSHATVVYVGFENCRVVTRPETRMGREEVASSKSSTQVFWEYGIHTATDTVRSDPDIVHVKHREHENNRRTFMCCLLLIFADGRRHLAFLLICRRKALPSNGGPARHVTVTRAEPIIDWGFKAQGTSGFALNAITQTWWTSFRFEKHHGMFHCHLLIHSETAVNKRASMQGLFPGQTASPRLRNVFGIGAMKCCGHHDLDLKREDSSDKLI
jgi:hypothetical protein